MDPTTIEARPGGRRIRVPRTPDSDDPEPLEPAAEPAPAPAEDALPRLSAVLVVGGKPGLGIAELRLGPTGRRLAFDGSPVRFVPLGFLARDDELAFVGIVVAPVELGSPQALLTFSGRDRIIGEGLIDSALARREKGARVPLWANVWRVCAHRVRIGDGEESRLAVRPLEGEWPDQGIIAAGRELSRKAASATAGRPAET